MLHQLPGKNHFALLALLHRLMVSKHIVQHLRSHILKLLPVVRKNYPARAAKLERTRLGYLDLLSDVAHHHLNRPLSVGDESTLADTNRAAMFGPHMPLQIEYIYVVEVAIDAVSNECGFTNCVFTLYEVNGEPLRSQELRSYLILLSPKADLLLNNLILLYNGI